MSNKPKQVPKQHLKIFHEFQREQQEEEQEKLRRQEKLMSPEEREKQRQEDSIQEVLRMTFGEMPNW